MLERGQKFPQNSRNFPATFDFFRFSQTLFTFSKKHLNIFFLMIKKPFGNPEKLKNCGKVAGIFCPSLS